MRNCKLKSMRIKGRLLIEEIDMYYKLTAIPFVGWEFSNAAHSKIIVIMYSLVRRALRKLQTFKTS